MVVVPPKKVLIMGLPGAGKTTLAKELAPMLGAVHFNADEIRKEINTDLGFDADSRLIQARRMGILCDIVNRAGHWAIADFVCPTEATREAFHRSLTRCWLIWVNRIESGRFEDTNRIFKRPSWFTFEVTAEGTPEFWAREISRSMKSLYQE